MRILVFFDLPVKTKAERRRATRFRKDLINDGMLQLSVYSRICKGEDTAEKQYASMDILVGLPKKTEKIGAEQLVLL